MQHKFNKRKYLAFILCVLALCVATRILFKTGFENTADYHEYGQTAAEISRGHFPLPSNHWMTRIGNTFSIACSFFLFGVNEYSIFAASIFFSLLNLLLIFALSKEVLGQDFSPFTIISTSILFIFSPLSIYLGSTPDYAQALAFFMFLSVYFYLRALSTDKNSLFILSGLSIGIAYLFHATALYIFLLLFTHSIFYKKLDPRLIFLFLGFLTVLTIENTIYYNITGQWLFRQKIATRTHFGAQTLASVSPPKLQTIDNPFKGTVLGDSWLLEPFRQLLLNPVNSILFYLFFLVNIPLLIKRNKTIILLNIFFWPLFLYISYGSPNPLSYSPFRRLPRTMFPSIIPAVILVSYGMAKIIKNIHHRYVIIALYVLISIFCITIKGGTWGQAFYQSKFFFKFIKQRPNHTFVTDNNTYMGLLLLNKYKVYDNVIVIPTNDFLGFLDGIDTLGGSSDANNSFFDFVDSINVSTGNIYDYALVNYPEVYGVNQNPHFDNHLLEIRSNDRKPRRICSLSFFRRLWSHSFCNLSNGGRILKVTF